MIERPVRCDECVCCSMADDHLIYSRTAEIMAGYYRGTAEIVKPDDYCSKEIRKSSAGCEACAPMENEPAIDAESIRHSHWIWCETYLDGEPEYPCELLKEGWACSACGAYLMEYLQSHFHDIPSYAECISDEMPTIERCPHCGAKMDRCGDATH